MIEGRAPAPAAARLLGWKLQTIDPDQGTVRVEFDAKPEFLNPVGTIQGGILTAMLDDTVGPAAAALLGGDAFAQTLELKASFIHGARVGPLYGEGRVVHRGREIIFVEGSLRDPEGRLVATATATLRVIPFGDRSGGR